MSRGGVAELAYAADLKSAAERIVGSSPTAPTTSIELGERRYLTDVPPVFINLKLSEIVRLQPKPAAISGKLRQELATRPDLLQGADSHPFAVVLHRFEPFAIAVEGIAESIDKTEDGLKNEIAKTGSYAKGAVEKMAE